jgi:DNA-binding NarL/FixJ family response regulator
VSVKAQIQKALKLHVCTSDATLRTFVESHLRASGFTLSDTPKRQGVNVIIIIDNPLTWALKELTRLTKIERTRTVVSTMGRHPIYRDCLASYEPSGVVISTDAQAGLAAIYAASAGISLYRPQSDLTNAELRIMRLLLKGEDADDMSMRLHISKKTINSHISNILSKTQSNDRAQLVAKVLGYCP